MIGSAWSSKDPHEQFVLYVVGPGKLNHPSRWRCLVLMDSLNLEDVGSFVWYSESMLREDFERVG